MPKEVNFNFVEPMEKLTLDDVLKLLGTKSIPGSPEEQEVLVQWTEYLAQNKGEKYIRKYRKRIFRDWQNILEYGLSRI